MSLRPCIASLAAVAVTVSLAACSDDGATADIDASPSGTVTASSTASATPDGGDGEGSLTAPGTQLTFGDLATVRHRLRASDATLGLRVDSAARGRLSDLSGFALDDPYKRNGHYFYVRVTVRNKGDRPVGGFPVPLWGISGKNTLLRSVDFRSSFARCPTEPLPAQVKPGASFKTCLVYLSPDRGTLEGVSYRPTERFVPIEWHGAVAKPKPVKRQGDKKRDDKKQDGGQR